MARSKVTRFTLTDAVCHWCHKDAGRSPFRTPISGVPGARWIVCGADCPERPEGAVVFSYFAATR